MKSFLPYRKTVNNNPKTSQQSTTDKSDPETDAHAKKIGSISLSTNATVEQNNIEMDMPNNPMNVSTADGALSAIDLSNLPPAVRAFIIQAEKDKEEAKARAEQAEKDKEEAKARAEQAETEKDQAESALEVEKRKREEVEGVLDDTEKKLLPRNPLKVVFDTNPILTISEATKKQRMDLNYQSHVETTYSTNSDAYFNVKKNIKVVGMTDADLFQVLQGLGDDEKDIMENILKSLIRDSDVEMFMRGSDTSTKMEENCLESQMERNLWPVFERVIKEFTSITGVELGCTVAKSAAVAFGKDISITQKSNCDQFIQLSATYDDAGDGCRISVYRLVLEVKPTHLCPRGTYRKELLRCGYLDKKTYAEYLGSNLYDESHCAIRQAVTYMIEYRSCYGIVSTFEKWYFLVLVIDDVDPQKTTLYTSRPYEGVVVGNMSSECPVSLWEALYRFLLLAKPRSFRRRAIPGVVDWYKGTTKSDYDGDGESDTEEEKQVKLKSTLSKSSSSVGETVTTKSSSGSKRRYTVYDLFDERHWSFDINDGFEEERLSGTLPNDAIVLYDGNFGKTYRKTFEGVDTVIKTISLDEEQSRPSVMKEKNAFKKMKHLQGIVIPTLFYVGVMKTGFLDCVVTSYEGIVLTAQSIIDQEFVDRCVDALKQIHASGVLHGDIALRNIVMRSGNHPVWIDFGCSTLDETDHSRAEAEVNELHDILTPLIAVAPKQVTTRKRAKLDDGILI
jgi:tRNA A-37 threonylcarbamoyl transferase component Bud32